MILNNTLTTTGGGGADNIRTPIIYSYVGTGTYGPDHPNVITLDFEPVFIQVLFLVPIKSTNNLNYILNPYDSDNLTGGRTYMITNSLTTSYQANQGLKANYRFDNTDYAKRSEDGKTIYWYINGSEPAPYQQFNDSNYTYYLLIY